VPPGELGLSAVSTSAPTTDRWIFRLRRFVRRYRARTQGFVGIARLMLYGFLGKLDEVWIGDSHAVHMNSPTMITALRRLPDGRWVMHVGPRVMFSISREGLPTAALRVMRLLSHTRRAREIVWAFSFGEIDVRCHLVPRMGDPDAALAFVQPYLEHLQSAATSAGARRALVLIPPPESDVYPDQIGFPVVGSLAERIEASHALRDAMVKAAAGLPIDGCSLSLIDLTDDFSDERGAMREDLTYDGLHANDDGRAVFRRHVEEILRATSS
jgi:lysophospholipase L1-like esterase